MTGKYPQPSYAQVVHTIQSEWIFLQCVTKNTGYEFAGEERILWGTILPRLLFRKSKSILPIVGNLSMIPVKKSGLGLQNPVISTDEIYLSL